MEDEVIGKGNFVELRIKDTGDSKYEYSHENRCDGEIVAFLPFHSERGFLLRHEVTPAWAMTEQGFHINSFTGGWEKDKHQTPVDTVIAELREEAGITLATTDSIKSLGTCHGAKSCDSIYHLFSVDLNLGYTEGDTEADGALEARETCEWYPKSLDWISMGVDPMLYVIYLRKMSLLGKPFSQ